MFHFNWQSKRVDGGIEVHAPGCDKIAFEIGAFGSEASGEIEGDTLFLSDTSEQIFVKLFAGDESTRWVVLKPDVLSMALANAKEFFVTGA
jgi:hypothetical protein